MEREAANPLSKLGVLAPDGVEWALAVANRNFIIQTISLLAGTWAATAAFGWRSSRRWQASPMIPLESSARVMTLIAEARALCVTG
ncbi:MAG: hypothetical protein U0990_07275 [Candidatus Nanopelagicales bacterium]|nr:hypothetical protein [Candidatus Nanopelagicales bacterium]MDZ4249877.1 hypothetical protein [Candidatus Nanopelagicales bacterium]